MSDLSLKDHAKERKLDQDHKRELNQKHKWARGEGPVTSGQLGRRPAKPLGLVLLIPTCRMLPSHRKTDTC